MNKIKNNSVAPIIILYLPNLLKELKSVRIKNKITDSLLKTYWLLYNHRSESIILT